MKRLLHYISNNPQKIQFFFDYKINNIPDLSFKLREHLKLPTDVFFFEDPNIETEILVIYNSNSTSIRIQMLDVFEFVTDRSGNYNLSIEFYFWDTMIHREVS